MFTIGSPLTLNDVLITRPQPVSSSNDFIKSLIDGKVNKQPYYNSQYAALPKVYAQDASLEISKLDVIKKYKTITGKKILPYHSKNLEGFDINFPIDLIFAKFIIKKKLIKFQKISKKSFFKI